MELCAAPRADSQRTVWPDVAKGLCIILVVLWHVVTKHHQRVEWDTTVPWSGAWGVLGEQLLPLRMPLFFTVSGVFAIGAIGRSWPELLRSKIAFFAYVYVVWLMIHTAVLWVTPDFATARARTASELFEQLTITPTNLWYLYALAAFFVIARLTRRVPTGWLLAAAFVLSAVAAAHLLPTPSNRGQVYQNLVFFLGGLRLRPVIVHWAESATPRRLVTTGGTYAAAAAAMTALGAERWFGVWPTVSVAAVCWGVVAAVMISRRLPRCSRGLSRLGQRTLPVYVMHLPLLALADRLLRGPWRSVEPRTDVVAAVEPIVATILLIAVCLTLHRVLLRLRLRWLFALPSARRGSSVSRPVPT